MQESENHSFKIPYTKRFHDYFYYKIKRKEINADDFFTIFGVAEISRYSFFSSMRSGKGSVTAEHIRIAFENYGVKPDYFFGASEEIMIGDMAQLQKSKEILQDIETLKQGLNALEKKITNG